MNANPVESQTQAAVTRSPQNEGGLSIVVPVYNEEGIVTETASSLTKVAQNLGSECEVIFVNDGSGDGTAEALSKVSGIRVICHANNRGYGAALKTGIRAAKHRWIAITDADGTYPNQRIPELLGLAQAQNCDMVVGSRTSAKVHIPLIRRPAKWLLSKLASYLAGYEIQDLNSGLRVMKKDVVMRFAKILPDGFSYYSYCFIFQSPQDFHTFKCIVGDIRILAVVYKLALDRKNNGYRYGTSPNVSSFSNGYRNVS
jgi:glycosyltransferase involved in cell wall biosynthesis